ncbi:Mu-like prophage major head subunit gpT family protein [Pseudoalteromonas galatheae]|uniref:Mu-like prophage major head subunit gpT family protein n=2 Tax=Pseudoalteromonas galatheae TaxID=579562 RepID=UPI0030D16032
MAIITPALLTSLQVGFKKNFQNGLDEAKPSFTQIATVIPSSTKSNTYGWLGKFPSLQKWVGDRQLQSMKAHAYSIVNDDWEASISVDRNDIEDDELGIYAPLMQEMGRSAAIHPDEVCYPLLASGFTTLCYDGQNYFDTDHPVYEKVDGSGAVESVANMAADGAYTGPAWYVLDTSKVLKPIIFQERKKPQFTSMTKLDDEAVFTSKLYRYGTDCRDAAGFSFWQLAFGNNRELNADNLWDAITKMREFKADGGRKLGIRPTTLVVPPGLEKVATRLLERELDANSSNELKNRLTLVVADYL